MTLITIDREIKHEIQERGYSWLSADEFNIAAELEAERESFLASWERLELDNYLQDAARFRLRRWQH